TSHARPEDERAAEIPESIECSVAQKRFRAARTCRSGRTTKGQDVQETVRTNAPPLAERPGHRGTAGRAGSTGRHADAAGTAGEPIGRWRPGRRRAVAAAGPAG